MKHRREGGFSLVELILAIVVGVSFILSMEVVITNYLHLGQHSRGLILANSYVEGKIEALRSSGYNSLNSGTTDLTSELPAQLNSPKNASMTISNPSSGIKQVDISITYNDQGDAKNYTYRTYVGELGVGQ